MAMTKKEREQMDAAIHKAELLAALRWTAPVEKDLPPPDKCGVYSEGWDYILSTQRVYVAWSDFVSHGTGHAPINLSQRHGSQNSIWLYSTREKALAALRHAIEKEAASKLLACDKQINAKENQE
jgi:hypothetical protein